MSNDAAGTRNDCGVKQAKENVFIRNYMWTGEMGLVHKYRT